MIRLKLTGAYSRSDLSFTFNSGDVNKDIQTVLNVVSTLKSATTCQAWDAKDEKFFSGFNSEIQIFDSYEGAAS